MMTATAARRLTIAAPANTHQIDASRSKLDVHEEVLAEVLARQAEAVS